jgi:hypothetical protein
MCNHKKASTRLARLRVGIPLVLALVASACLPGARRDSAGSSTTHLERLYFGRNIADTAVVSDSAWGTFVRDVLTPQFPEGATVYEASGQWRSPTGVLVKEPSYVVELLHPATPESEGKVKTVIEAYKTRFAQEAVLRMVTNVRAMF